MKKKGLNLTIRPYTEPDETAVIRLWEICGLVVPWNDPKKDIARKLRVQRDWFLVGLHRDRLIATIMIGYEGHRGWVNYLAVHPDFQKEGIGRRLMDEAERLLKDFGCPKLQLQVRTSNQAVIEFYRRIGYRMDDVVSLGKRLISDE